MKALTQEQVASFRHDGFLFPIPALAQDEVATCLAGLDRLEADLGSPGRRSGREVALPCLCPLAVVQRPDPPSAHPRCDRGRDRPRHPGLDQHLLHQGAALADLRRLAPGRHLFRPGAAGAGLRLGRADRCHAPRPAAWRCCRPAAPRARCTTRHSVSRTASTVPARRSRRRSTTPARWRWRCPPGPSRCTTSLRCTAPHPTARRTGGSASG